MNSIEDRYNIRKGKWNDATSFVFDAIVVGGGISGASIYHQLCQEGYKVLLVERGDFASRTSQASAMWIWGGLIHLAQFDIPIVRKLSRDRDRLIRELPKKVNLCPIRYILTKNHGRGRFLVETALYIYWLLGNCRRSRPRFQTIFPELDWLKQEIHSSSLIYEEGAVIPSDARFVIDLILAYQNDTHIPMNYTSVKEGDYDQTSKLWHIELQDHILDLPVEVRTKWVINASGCWTNEINQIFGISSSWKHVFSKGVHIGFPRYPHHITPLAFENLQYGDIIALIPWGPISFWSSTETAINELVLGYNADVDDVRFLLGEWNRHIQKPVGVEDIISLRCGVRPLAVPINYEVKRLTFDISRKHVIEFDSELPWISVYGGKLTSSFDLGETLVNQLKKRYPSPLPKSTSIPNSSDPQYSDHWPGLEAPVLSAQYSAVNESCWTIDDYLRRRTNISQWIYRMGLGKNNENMAALSKIAEFFPGKKGTSPAMAIEDYLLMVDHEFDSVLKRV